MHYSTSGIVLHKIKKRRCWIFVLQCQSWEEGTCNFPDKATSISQVQSPLHCKRRAAVSCEQLHLQQLEDGCADPLTGQSGALHYYTCFPLILYLIVLLSACFICKSLKGNPTIYHGGGNT